MCRGTVLGMIEVRRHFTHVEDIWHDFGPPQPTPLRRGGAVVILRNPFAGRFEADIAPFMEELKLVGVELARRLIAALGVNADAIEGYGKAAIVGAAGELEHGALWHVPGGYAMREALGWQTERVGGGRKHGGGRDGTESSRRGDVGNTQSGALTESGARAQGGRTESGGRYASRPGNALAIVPSTKKVGPPGATIDVPLTHINASYVRSHLDAIELRVPGAPAADELAYILAMSTGPRVHARLGGLTVEQIGRWDGQR